MGDNDRDNNYWRSPGGGGRGFAQQWNRGFRGHNYGGSPRFNQGGWQHRSPYRQHGYRQNAPFSSTPINNYPYRQHRPNFSGRGRFNSPRSFHESNAEQGIEAWVSPAMWDDPWKEFTSPYCDDQSDLNVESEKGLMSTTKFTNDLDESSSANVTASTSFTLEVSDMIMRSAMESGIEVESSDPLPDISLDDLESHQARPTTPQNKTEGDDLNTQDSRNLSMI